MSRFSSLYLPNNAEGNDRTADYYCRISQAGTLTVTDGQGVWRSAPGLLAPANAAQLKRDSRTRVTEDPAVYHATVSAYFERQDHEKRLCACHSVNNLLQVPVFSADHMREIALNLEETEAALTHEEGLQRHYRGAVLCPPSSHHRLER